MKVTELLSAVEKAVNDLPFIGNGSYSIVVREGKIQCIHSTKLDSTDVFVINVGQLELAQGFNSHQWARIFRELHLQLQNGRIK